MRCVQNSRHLWVAGGILLAACTAATPLPATPASASSSTHAGEVGGVHRIKINNIINTTLMEASNKGSNTSTSTNNTRAGQDGKPVAADVRRDEDEAGDAFSCQEAQGQINEEEDASGGRQ